MSVEICFSHDHSQVVFISLVVFAFPPLCFSRRALLRLSESTHPLERPPPLASTGSESTTRWIQPNRRDRRTSEITTRKKEKEKDLRCEKKKRKKFTREQDGRDASWPAARRSAAPHPRHLRLFGGGRVTFGGTTAAFACQHSCRSSRRYDGGDGSRPGRRHYCADIG